MSDPHAGVDDADGPDEVTTVLLPGDEPATSWVPPQQRDSRTVVHDDTSNMVAGETMLTGPRHLAICRPCDIGRVPFRDEASRDRWAAIHAAATGHRVTLATDDPAAGSTITGYADPPTRLPDPLPLVRGTAPVAGARVPLVEFVARAGMPPDLVCTIPPAAGAAWLLVAAHACMMGRGSLGVEQPHRVLYTGRAEHTTDDWLVGIDGVFGAPLGNYGAPIGRVYRVAADATPAVVEQVVAKLIADGCDLPAHEIAVVLLVDGPKPGASLAEVTPPG